MAKRTPPTDRNNQQIPYTMIPNVVLRSRLLDAYDKLIYCLIESCDPSFPSYEALHKWSGFSRERIWKSLRRLEKNGVIQRFRMGRSTLYRTYFTSSPDEPFDALPVRYTNSTSSPDELEPVRQTNPKKNNEKEQIKMQKVAAPSQESGERFFEDPEWLQPLEEI